MYKQNPRFLRLLNPQPPFKNEYFSNIRQYKQGSRGVSYKGLDFKMKLKMQTWDSEGYGTQVTIKILGPLV